MKNYGHVYPSVDTGVKRTGVGVLTLRCVIIYWNVHFETLS